MKISEIIGRILHKYLHWHKPKETVGSFDGASFHSICKYCSKEIMQDSQGGWF